MKFSSALALALVAGTAAAQTAAYSAEHDETCILKEDGTIGDCVKGKTEGAIDYDNYTEDVITEGRSLPRGMAPRISFPTCFGPSWLANMNCRAKCRRIHGKPCGGRCDGFCYCSAKC